MELMQRLADEAPEEWRSRAGAYRYFAKVHHDIVANYGRFPRRNAMVGRTSTEAETRYLADGGHTLFSGSLQ
jgi:uncharacterized protein (DUF924 family)